MHKRLLYILTILMVLTSCDEDNWFSHRVEYKDVIEPQQLVLTSFLQPGKEVRLMVNHSWFFLDPNRADKRTNNWNGEDRYGLTKEDPLPDAVVTMTVNGKTTYTLTYTQRASDRYSFITERYYTTDEYTVTSGDQLFFTVTHPDYGTATTSEYVPYHVPFTVDGLSEDGCNATFNLHLQSYPYQEGDVLLFRAHTVVRMERFTKDRDVLYYRDTTYFHNGRPYQSSYPVYSEWYDTSYVYSQQENYVYGQHMDFSRFEGNRAMSKGYYGNDCRYDMGLCLPASAVKDGLTIPMATFLTYKQNQSYSRPGYYEYDGFDDPYFVELYDSTAYSLDSIELEVFVLSAQETMCRIANDKIGGSHYVPAYPQSESSIADDAGDIIDEIQDMFDTMGNMEGYQVYDNVAGGIGHVTASARQKVVLRMEK